MKSVTITIATVNGAFGNNPGHEIARILRELAGRFENYIPADDVVLPYDVNGNTVGKVTIQ